MTRYEFQNASELAQAMIGLGIEDAPPVQLDGAWDGWEYYPIPSLEGVYFILYPVKIDGKYVVWVG